MSRLEDIIKGIREQGLIQDEELILELAREKHRHEKMKNLQENQINLLKKSLNKSAS